MSLRFVHIVFMISVATLAAILGYWGLTEYQNTAATSALTLAVLSLASLFPLALYLKWFVRKWKDLPGYPS